MLLSKSTRSNISVLAGLFVLSMAVIFAGCTPTEDATAGFKKLTMEDVLFGNNEIYAGMEPAPRITMWFPDGNSFIYQMREGEGKEAKTISYKYNCATKESTKIADWGELQKKIRKMAKDRPRKVMDDVNLAGRVNTGRMSMSADGTMMLGKVNTDLYLYYLESGEVKFITDDPGDKLFPTLSPDGKKVAFTRDKDLHVLNISSGKITKLTDRKGNKLIYNGIPDWVYDEEFGLRNAFWWSPDSTRLAYLKFDTTNIKTFPIVEHLPVINDLEEQQYPKPGDPNSIVSLGVVSVNGGATKWINTGKEEDSYIPRVGWLPDSSRVWFYWKDRDQTVVDLMFANPATGAVKSIVKEEDSAWVDARDEFRFIDDNHFLWSSERTGYRHLYVYKTDGIMERQLTDGQWEVTRVAGFDSEKKHVFFTSTEVSPLESHIYKVNLEDGTKTQLSKGEGSHGIRMAPAGDYYVHTYSNLTTPTMTELCDVNGEQTWLMSDGAMPGLKDYYYSVPEIHTIKSDDGEVDLYVSIVKPHNFDENKKYPVMVSIYGGPGSGGGVSNRFAYRAGQQFWAQEGVILFNVANRGTNNRGRDFMKIVHKNLGHYELTDYVTGVNWLKTHKWVDGSKVSIEGYSYGGYMTLMAMNKAPDTFQFGVCGSPVTDWRFYDTIYTERYMDTPQSNPEGYKESAPIHFADAFKGKLLLTHGTMDNNVHLANAMVMAEEYQRAGKEFEFYLYARERHGIRARHRSMHRRKVIFSFYMKNLLGTEIDWNTYQKPEAEEKEAE